jgi:C1A family cysteine protease
MGMTTSMFSIPAPHYLAYMPEEHEFKSKRIYSWKRSKKLATDKYHKFDLHPNLKSITSIDLRSKMPPVYDQGHLGSCTANAIAAAYEFDEKEPKFVPSRLFIYYNERKIENDINQDVGGSLKDGIASVNTTGVCPEDSWPYDITKFTIQPPDICYEIAKKHVSIEYKRVEQNLDQITQCLLNGLPIVFGFEVFPEMESQEVAKTGILPMPTDGEKNLGGHAVVIVSCDHSTKQFMIRNSWGSDWGIGGYFYMPFDYVLNPEYADDFWTIQKVSD